MGFFKFFPLLWSDHLWFYQHFLSLGHPSIHPSNQFFTLDRRALRFSVSPLNPQGRTLRWYLGHRRAIDGQQGPRHAVADVGVLRPKKRAQTSGRLRKIHGGQEPILLHVSKQKSVLVNDEVWFEALSIWLQKSDLVMLSMPSILGSIFPSERAWQADIWDDITRNPHWKIHVFGSIKGTHHQFWGQQFRAGKRNAVLMLQLGCCNLRSRRNETFEKVQYKKNSFAYTTLDVCLGT